MRTALSLLLFCGCGGATVHPLADGGGHAITDDGHGTYTIALDHFVVAPGQERYACQDFANPFGGAPAAIHQFASHMTPGSHHLLVFYKPGAGDGALADCSGTEFAAGPYGSQRPDDAIVYPDGVAAVVAPTDGFRVQAHYLNASSAPLDVAVEVRLTRVDDATVRDRRARRRQRRRRPKELHPALRRQPGAGDRPHAPARPFVRRPRRRPDDLLEQPLQRRDAGAL
jgi:hypothetical protein